MTCIQGTILARCQLQLLPTIFPLIGMSISLYHSLPKAICYNGTPGCMDQDIYMYMTGHWPIPKVFLSIVCNSKQRKRPRDDATSCSQFVSIVSASTQVMLQVYTKLYIIMYVLGLLQSFTRLFPFSGHGSGLASMPPLCSLPCPQEPAIMANCIEGPDEGLQSNKPWDI